MRKNLIIPLMLCIGALLPLSVPAQKRALPPEPEKTFQWKNGAPYADEILSDGVAIRIIKNGDLTIAVAGYDTGDYIFNEVTVVNKSTQRINVKPEDFFITYQDDSGRADYMYSLPPEKVTSKYKSRAKWGNFFRTLGGELARTTSTSDTEESGTVHVYGNGQYATGVYNGSSTTTTTSPNVGAQRSAVLANQRATEAANTRAEMIIGATLKANTLFPKTYISGRVYFERKKYKVGNFIMIIDGTAYIFSYYGTQK